VSKMRASFASCGVAIFAGDEWDERFRRALPWIDDAMPYLDVRAVCAGGAGVLPIHLWGHLQEAALAKTGSALGQPELVECACASAEALLIPAVDSEFDFEPVLPFDVSCAVAGLVAVARATSNERYASSAARGREWIRRSTKLRSAACLVRRPPVAPERLRRLRTVGAVVRSSGGGAWRLRPLGLRPRQLGVRWYIDARSSGDRRSGRCPRRHAMPDR
jgi:hypothetical protein